MEGNMSEIFITHVGDDGPLLKIWGQTDRTVPTNIERMIGQFTPQFNQGVGTPNPLQLSIGQLCCAQYLDGTYYRARITSLDDLDRDQVSVQFADYGNHEVITLSNIRILDGVMTPLATCADQAHHFYLANIAPMSGEWSSESLKFVKDTACYMDLKFATVGKVANSHFIRVQLQNGGDLGEFLCSRRISVSMLLDTQIGILHSIINKVPLPQMQLWPRFNPDVPPPLPMAQMMVTQLTAQAIEENVMERFAPQLRAPPGLAAPHPATAAFGAKPPASRLVYPGRDAYGAPVNQVPAAPPIVTPPVAQYAAYPERRGPNPTPPAAYAAYADQLRPPTISPPGAEVAGFEVRRLTINTAYPVRVVHVEDGPESFIVFLKDMEADLGNMLSNINSQRPVHLSAPPMTGTICLGRSRDMSLLRAVVVHVGNTCKLYFVDFGTTEEVAYDDIFAIPPHYVANPKPMCVRFTHGGLDTFEVTKEIKDVFASVVTGKDFTLYVTAAEGHHLKQCGILFDHGKSVLNNVKLQIDSRKHNSYQLIPAPKVGSTKSVSVQNIESMSKFFVILEDNVACLHALMLDLAKHCKEADSAFVVPPECIRPGLVCCAQYAEDKQWYRAQVLGVEGNGSVRVFYVDYGNCDTVGVDAMRMITPELVSAQKAQAIECCLSGYEGVEGDENVVERFSELVVDKTLIAYVVKHSVDGVPVVNLHDLSATPLLSVGTELEKMRSVGGGSEAPLKVAEPCGRNSTQGNNVYLQPGKTAQSGDDSKNRGGAGDDADWRARPTAARNGKMDTWEGSREGKAAAAADGFTLPEVRTNDVKAAQLVFVENPEDFYVQITPDTALVDMMADIATAYAKGGRPLSRPSRGAPCIARFADDGEWYRAAVQSADSRAARVSFVDYGNVDDVPLADVREIAPAFARLPAQAVRCCLSGSLPKAAEWSAEEIASFTEMMDGKPLEVKFGTERNGVFSVQVTDGETGEKINDKFGAFVEKSDASSAKPAVAQGYDKPTQSYDKPSNAQGHDKPNRSQSFEKGEHGGDRPNRGRNFDRTDQSFEKGDRPYRGQNLDRGDPSLDRPGRTQNHERQDQGFDRPNRAQGSDRPPRNFNDGASAKAAPQRKPEPPARVQEFARPDERLGVVEIAPADCQEVGVTWFISPEEFYVGQASTAAAFDKMMRELQPAYRGTKPVEAALEIGAPCVAVFAEDKSLCRAEVVAAPNPYAYIVRFVDYGNCELVSKKDLFPIESRFLSLPKVAVLCSLLDVKPVEDAWPKTSDQIDALFRSDKFQCTFHAAVDGKYQVSLVHGSVDVATALIDKGLAKRPAPPAPAAPTSREEPLPRSALVGQTLRANVTYVEGVGRFYVHLGANRVDEIQAAVDAYVAQPENKRAFPAAEVQTDRLCIASADGAAWYRGRIVDCTGTAGIFVSFVDYGDGDEVTADKMLAMPDELAAFPAQAVECSLACADGVDVMPDAEDAFKAAVEGTDVVVTVTALHDSGVLSVHVFGEDGVAQPTATAVGVCPASVPPLRALPMLTQHVAVFVSHADDVANVWLQRAADADALAEMLGALYGFYEEEKSGVAVTSLEPGVVCAARAEDEQWYRAEVLAVEGAAVSVRFIDYGNAEEVPAELVRSLDARFTTAHLFAVRVSLPLQPDAAREVDLMALAAETVFVAAFARDAALGWRAELFNGKDTFSDSLVEMGLKLAEDCPFEESRDRLTRSPKLVPGLSLPVFVSHVGGPDDIWLQLGADVDDIERLQGELQAAVEDMEELSVPVAGNLGAAVFSEDAAWYRAEVLTANDSVVTVRFVDYGNTDMVDIMSKPLRRLPRKLAAAERYATRCGLDVSPIDRDFGHEVTERIQALLAADGNALTATVVKEGNVVDLAVNGKSLFETLTEEALVIPYYHPDTVFVSHVVSPAEFYVQYQSATFQLETMAERMTEAAEFDPLAETNAGTLCAAQFVDDDAWYRAKIIGTAPEGSRVFFVDFGNSAVSTQLRALPEDLSFVPLAAKRCALVGAERLSEAAASRFAELAVDASFVVEIVALADPVVVELTCDGKRVGEMLAKIGTKAEGEEVKGEKALASDVEEKAVGDDESMPAGEIEEVGDVDEAVSAAKGEVECEIDGEKESEVEADAAEEAVDGKDVDVEEEVVDDEQTVVEAEAVDEKDAIVEEEIVDGKGAIVEEEAADEQETVAEEKAEVADQKPEMPASKTPTKGMGTVCPPLIPLDSVPEDEEVGAAVRAIVNDFALATVDEANELEASDESFASAKGVDDEEPDIGGAAAASEEGIEGRGAAAEQDPGGDLDAEVSEHFARKPAAAVGRPTTPHDCRIVAGAVSRGLSVEELAESVPTAEDLVREAEAAAVSVSSPREVERVVRPRSCPVPDVPIASPRLAHSERIVPGSVSLSTSMEALDGEGAESKADVAKATAPEGRIGQGDEAARAVNGGR